MVHKRKQKYNRVWVWKPEEKSHWKDQGIDGVIILKQRSNIANSSAWNASIWLRIGSSGVVLLR